MKHKNIKSLLENAKYGLYGLLLNYSCNQNKYVVVKLLLHYKYTLVISPYNSLVTYINSGDSEWDYLIEQSPPIVTTLCCSHGKIAMLKLLLDDKRFSLHEPVCATYNLIYAVADCGDPEIIQLLLDDPAVKKKMETSVKYCVEIIKTARDRDTLCLILSYLDMEHINSEIQKIFSWCLNMKVSNTFIFSWCLDMKVLDTSRYQQGESEFFLDVFKWSKILLKSFYLSVDIIRRSVDIYKPRHLLPHGETYEEHIENVKAGQLVIPDLVYHVWAIKKVLKGGINVKDLVLYILNYIFL
jgi:hypothetical protein